MLFITLLFNFTVLKCILKNLPNILELKFLNMFEALNFKLNKKNMPIC